MLKLFSTPLAAALPRLLIALSILALLVSSVPGSSATPVVGQPVGCGYTQLSAELLAETSLVSWTGWIRQLSGADPVTFGSETVWLTTRHSSALFNGEWSAYDFVRQQILTWHPAEWIEEDPYVYNGQTWKNLILTVPGSTRPDELVILSAHLDSTSPQPSVSAPGADDNATGAAALIEAARVLENQSLARTIRLIWFTGEEQGLRGSHAYLSDSEHPERLQGIQGVINLDMFGYDSDNDRCFELHVVRNRIEPAASPSSQVGVCFIMAVRAYGLDLKYDYLTSGATSSSDHASFWNHGIGAVEVLENFNANGLANGCSNADRNPYYHSSGDTVDKLNLTTAFDITRAAMAAAFSMANPIPIYRNYMPFLSW